MDNLLQKLHYFQVQILEKLSKKPFLKFNELLIENLESEHTNYHLQKLLGLKLVEKTTKGYTLTDKGKDYTNLMDDATKFIEKQPKTGVLLNITRVNDQGETEFLLSRRKKQPYFDKVGRLTGKVKFGETIIEAAEREFTEETGLVAINPELYEIYHKIRTREDGETVQDVIFYRVQISQFTGTLIEKTPYQENIWCTEKQALESSEIDLFEDLKFEMPNDDGILLFSESRGLAEGY